MANLIQMLGHARLSHKSLPSVLPYVLKYSYSSERSKTSSSSLTESKSSRGSSEISTTIQTVKETTKTAWYLSIIAGGVSITGAIFYVIFKELFSSDSPMNIFSAALDECIANKRVQDALGEPIKGHGEESRRGRHRHVSYQEYYDRDGKKRIKMRFYLKGSRRRATVYLEKKENDRGKFEYEYIQVVPENIVPTSIFVVDNRQSSESEVSTTLQRLY